MAVVPFRIFSEFEVPLYEIVVGRVGYVNDLFLDFPYEFHDDLPDGDRDLVILTGTGNRPEKLYRLGEYPGRVLLVLAPGDSSLRPSYVPNERTLPPNVTAAFVTNNDLADRRVVNLPLGVRADSLDALRSIRQRRDGRRDGLLYVNFTVNESFRGVPGSGQSFRGEVADRFADASWAELDISPRPRRSPDELIRYYEQMARHRFVLSPPGNGVDCFRTWESLYLGAIPIVTASPCMSSFADLPILFTDDYSEISPAYLEERWEEMRNRSFEISPLLSSFYLQRFLRATAALTDPRFVLWGFGSGSAKKFIAPDKD